MTQKKKLLDFLSNVPTILKEKTATSFNQLKQNTKTEQQFVTPVFANSQALVGNEEGERVHVEPINLNKRQFDEIKLDGDDINLHNVVTERSQQQEPTNKQEKKSLKKSQLSEIEQEKQRLQEMLRKVNSEIKELKDDGDNKKTNGPTNTFKRYKEISQDEKAYENAQKLVVKLHQEKKAQQQKRQKQQRQRLEQLERQTRLKEEERKEEMERQKEERRQIIARRIAQQQRKREERRMIDQQSNELIKQIRKDEVMKKPASTSLEIRELETKKKLLQKKRNFDFGEIQQHQKRYAQLKLKHAAHSSMEHQNHSYSVPKYPKGRFMEQIEQEQKMKKDEQKLREEERRNLVEKRLKYGELVKKIFLPPKPVKKPDEEVTRIKPPTPDVVVNGSIKQQIPRKTYTNSHDNINRVGRLPQLAKATGSLSKASNYQPDPMTEAEREEKERLKRQKLEREREIRRQTKQRLKHAQEAEHDRKRVQLPKVKKYENYLDKLPKHKSNTNQQEWKKIIDNESMTKQQKYRELMSKANYMENKAKFKEEMATGNNGENQEAMNLIIGSIQAKLALLDKF